MLTLKKLKLMACNELGIFPGQMLWRRTLKHCEQWGGAKF